MESHLYPGDLADSRSSSCSLSLHLLAFFSPCSFLRCRPPAKLLAARSARIKLGLAFHNFEAGRLELPLAEALVVFHPLDPTAGEVPRPLGQTDAQGRFELTTLESREGAPAGRYAICVERRQARLVGEETVRDGRNLLPARFGNTDSTPLKYEVIAGENEVPPLLIKRQLQSGSGSLVPAHQHVAQAAEVIEDRAFVAALAARAGVGQHAAGQAREGQ